MGISGAERLKALHLTQKPDAFRVRLDARVICGLYLKPNIFINEIYVDILSRGFEMKEFLDFELLHYEFL